MKKEVFLAISIGFILGLIITFGIWTANKSLKQAAKPTPTPEAMATSPTPSAAPSTLSLNITAPDDETLTNSATITLTGTTAPNADIAVLYEIGQTIIQADQNGKFSFDVPLDGGYNRITVTAYDQNGNTATQKLTVTYTTQKI